jgi:hypothetical protein
VDADHPSTEDLAAYLSGSLPASEALDLENHLSDCWSCRQEVIGGRRLLRSIPRTVPWLAVPAAAAAILALLLLRPGPAGRPGDEALRSESEIGAEGRSLLTVVSPEEGETLGVGAPFIWRSDPAQPLYRVTVADRTGRTLWTGDTSDTTLTTPPALRLDRGSRYFWYVDALDAEGRSVTTGTRSFYTPP